MTQRTIARWLRYMFTPQFILIGAFIALPVLVGLRYLDGVSIGGRSYYMTPNAQLLWDFLTGLALLVIVVGVCALVIVYINRFEPVRGNLEQQSHTDTAQNDTDTAQNDTDTAQNDTDTAQNDTDTAQNAGDAPNNPPTDGEQKTTVVAPAEPPALWVLTAAVASLVVTLMGVGVLALAGLGMLFTLREGEWRMVGDQYVFEEKAYGTVDSSYDYVGPLVMASRVDNLPPAVADDRAANNTPQPKAEPTGPVFATPTPSFEPPPPATRPSQAANTEKQLPSATHAQSLLNQAGVQLDDVLVDTPYAVTSVDTAGPAHIQVFAQYYKGKWVVLSVLPVTQPCKPGGVSFTDGLSPADVAQNQGQKGKRPNGVYPRKITLTCQSVDGGTRFNLQSADGGYTWKEVPQR